MTDDDQHVRLYGHDVTLQGADGYVTDVIVVAHVSRLDEGKSSHTLLVSRTEHTSWILAAGMLEAAKEADLRDMTCMSEEDEDE